MIDRQDVRSPSRLPLALAVLLVAAACGPSDDGLTVVPDGSLFRADGAPGASDAAGPTADANQCVTQPCDIHEQCGCGDDEACDIDPSEVGETACREVSAFGGHADTCDGLTGCRPGFVCVGDEPSFCRRYCQSDDDCPGAGALCRVELTDRDLTMCGFHCNAARTDGDGCPEARPGCYFLPIDDGPEHFTVCRAPGTAGHGQPCPSESRFDCRAGHVCLLFSGEPECRRTCVIGQAGGCPGDTVCRQHPSTPRVGEVEYGFCGAP